MKVVILGSGNVATLVGVSLWKAGYDIIQVWSRGLKHAESLGSLLHASYTDNLDDVIESADVYLLSISDDAIPLVISQLKPLKGVIVHTSGSTSMDVFQGKFPHYGVFYPFQTFSKGKDVNFKQVPILLEASELRTMTTLKTLARSLSDQVQECSSDQRKILHIAAVFACNFANYFYILSERLLEENDLSFELIRPLILETALKVQEIMPSEAQTGPAVRNDLSIIQSHLKVLEDKPELADIYRLLSAQISLFADKKDP